MFKRIVWFAAGTAVGVAGAKKAERAVRGQVERLAPSNVTSSVARAARGVGREVRGAVDEGRRTMQDEQARMQADLDPAGRRARSRRRSQRPARA